MLFRIDYERFLVHAIDHFTREELISFNYAIVGTLTNGGRLTFVSKINAIYPSNETTEAFREYEDKNLLKKMYYKDLDCDKYTLYLTFVNTMLHHQNIMIICHESENPYVDILVEYLKDKFKVECVDLNKLFIEGRVGSIYIDRKEIHNKAVDIRRDSVKRMIESRESTRDGRLELLEKHMDTNLKIKKLKELGIHVTKDDIDNIDQLLIEAWVEDE